MHLKQKSYFFTAFLICTAATLVAGFPQQRSAPKLRRRRGQTPNQEDSTGLLAPQRPSQHWFRHLDNLSDMDKKRTGTSTEAGGGEKTLNTKARQSSTQWVYVTPSPPAEDCVGGDVEVAKLGRFYVSGRLEVYIPNEDHQRDTADSGQVKVKGQRHRGSEKVWERLQPVVKCRHDNMTLTVRRRGVGQLLLQTVNDSSVPLSQLPPQCGYSLQSTWRDLSLMARYSACHVTLEGDDYVLPLLWRGTPVKVSCPASRAEPQRADTPTICCAPYGVTVRMHKVSAAEELGLNVRGEWTPLVTLAEQCGYTIERQDADVVITAPFITCGITVQDGKYSFSLRMGDDIFTLSCPVTPLEDHSLAESPPAGGDDRRPNPPGAFPWTPPFYLAPPHYPHPVHRHQDPSQGLNNPRSLVTTRTSSAPLHASGVAHSSLPDPSQAEDQTHVSHQVPTLESRACSGVHSPPAPETRMEDLIPHHPDLNQRAETHTLGFSEGQRASHYFALDPGVPAQVAVPLLQPLTDAFSQYYHYYHDPKIPLSDPPRHPNAAVQAFSQVDPRLPVPAARLHGTQQFGGQTRPGQYHYVSEYPYSERDEAKRFALHISETIPKPQFPVIPEYLKMTPYDASQSAHIHEKNNLASVGSQPTSQSRTPSPESRLPLPSAVIGADAEENLSRRGLVGDEAPAVPNLSPGYDFPQHPHYYVLYYPNHQMFDPGSVPAANSPPSPLSKEPSKRQTLPSQESPFKGAGDHRPQGPLFPYLYRYHDYDMSKASKDQQEVEPTRTANAESEFSDSPSNGVQHRAAVSGSTRLPGASEEAEVNGKALEGRSGWQLFFGVPDDVREATALDRPPEASNASCLLHQLNSDPNIFMVPLGGCGGGQYVAVRLLEEPTINSLHVVDSASESSVKLTGDCSPTGCPEEATLPVTTPTHLQSSADTATVQLRIATDESFGSFHPAAQLPLSLVRDRPVFLEVSLASPPQPDVVLLVHSCIAYTHTHWMSVYEGCSSGDESWLLPSSHSHHIQRVVVTSFLSPPSDSAATVAQGGRGPPEDAEIFFVCLAEVCSTAAGDCSQSCVNNPVKVTWSMN